MFARLLSFGSILVAYLADTWAAYKNTSFVQPSNQCIQFSVAPETGCAWMCQFCQDQLKTTNYYFPDGVCTYQPGGCVGEPLSGVQYQCCSNGVDDF